MALPRGPRALARGRACLALLVSLLGSGCGSVLRDWNGDGIRLIACAGDSNTEQLSNRKWCAYLRPLLPGWRTRAVAGWGAHARDVPGTFGNAPISSVFYVERMLAWVHRPDVALLAWGTNDVAQEAPAPIVEALAERAARLRSAGVAVLVATVPHALGDRTHNARVDAVNQVLVARLSPCVVDFTTPTPPTATFYVNRLHLNDAGQRARAAAAAAALRRAPRRCGP